MNNMRKTVLLILSLCISMFMFSGCINSDKAVFSAFEDMMSDLGSGDKSKISQYYDFDNANIGLRASDENRENLINAVCGLLRQMSYSDYSLEKQNKSTYIITFKLTSANTSAITDAYVKKISGFVSTPEYQKKIANMSIDEYQNIMADQMTEILTYENISSFENEISLTMVKEDGKWVPASNNDAFFNTLFGNILNAAGSLM